MGGDGTPQALLPCISCVPCLRAAGTAAARRTGRHATLLTPPADAAPPPVLPLPSLPWLMR